MANEAQRVPESRRSCCNDFGPWTFTISMTASDGQKHSFQLKQNKLVLDSGSGSAEISVSMIDLGVVTLGVPHLPQHFVVAEGALQLSEEAQTTFLMEPVPEQAGLVQFRTNEGLYLSASGPGAAVSLITESGPNTAFQLEPAKMAPPPPREIEAAVDEVARDTAAGVNMKVRPQPLWVADPGAESDEKHNTHLWIFHRALELVLERDKTDPRPNLARWLKDAEFVKGIERGLSDADNSGTPDTAGFIYSAHFYNPETKSGGYWDPLNNPQFNLNNPEVGKRNALEFGARYFESALADDNPFSCGRSLGLAMHYLEDLTQPMHCGLFPNNPILPWVSFRHEAYEQWALRIQDRCKLSLEELFSDSWVITEQRGLLWDLTARRGLAEYKTWEGVATSPIGIAASDSAKLSAQMPHDDWVPVTTRMLKLAQRVVIVLLDDWASKAKLAKMRMPGFQMCTDTGHHARLAVPGGRYDQVYVQLGAFSDDSYWTAEQVMESGKPVLEGGEPYFYIRNSKSNLCMVAGDIYDQNVYHQDPQGRQNAQWIFEPVLDGQGKRKTYSPKPGGPEYALYRVRDRLHGKYLSVYEVAHFVPVGHKSADEASKWYRIPRTGQ
jgi:hypothetical protein